ncbi:MAG: HNH endonuclease [Shinella sp.]|uniref:HNH endonuclease n=1 Tax=Shinella sp. TaxID=1870904 RepID=UPI00403610F1
MRKLCECCGRRFDAKSPSSCLCSEACIKVDARAKARAASVANDNVDRTPRPCAECATVFSTTYGDKRSVYCSTACSRRNARRIGRKKERARLRTQAVENVNPITVFERDKWKCQSCGVKTPRKLRGTFDVRAPELDHIMPLSLGGAHSYMNTQCLCRGCNAAKSDTAPAQPSLFAYAA